MKYSIMFVLKSFEMGGVEIVTSILANKFVAEGHNVSIFAFGTAEHSIQERLDDRIHCYTLKDFNCCNANVHAMRSVMVNENVDVVINQWGLPFVPIRVINKASKELNIKLISVYHNNPCFNGRIQKVQIALDQLKAKQGLKKILLKLRKKIYEEITSYGMRYNYYHSDQFWLLSTSFVSEFEKFTRIREHNHLRVQTNPITIDYSDYVYSKNSKQKEILYVGRLDYLQKRVFRIIDTWKQLEDKFPEWKLTIVGIGDEENKLKEQVRFYGLKHVFFEGFQNPQHYYERASILMLTSEYEGFPLVLVECMCFGVVPVAYASYPAVNDIIRDDINGKIAKPINDKFVTNNMAISISKIMVDDDFRDVLAKNAIQTVTNNYSINYIYKQWINKFND